MLLTSWLNGIFRARSPRRASRRAAHRLRTTQLVGATEVLEDRTLLSTFYVDNAGDFAITNDQGAGGLDAGDTVTWDNGQTHPDGPVAGLIFGTNAFASIQAAVDAADASIDPTDTINVAAGTYNENVSIDTSVILRGAQVGVDATVNPGARGAESIITATSAAGIEVRADNVTIDGFEITDYNRDGINVRPTNSGGGVSTRSNIVIQNNYIHEDLVSGNQVNGIVFGEQTVGGPDSPDNATISNVTIANNFIDVTDDGTARGIVMTGQFASIVFDDFNITENVIQAKNNGLFISENPALYTANGIEILDNRFEEPGSTGINLGNLDSTSKINGNTFINNASGASVNFRQAGGEVLNNTFENHTNVGLSFFNAAFFPQSSEDANVSGNTFINNARHVGAPALAVDLDAIQNNNTFDRGARASSVRNIYGNIQPAIDAATAGDTVNVFAGTYNENVTVNKNLSLLSTDGRDDTTITGISGAGSLGTVVVTNNTSDVTIGDTNQGFTIIGIDNGMPGIENAAVYFQGAHTGATVRGNEIVANGDHGLLNEFGVAVSGFVIDNNIFSGQTFVGPNPAGTGSTNQFSLPNVPRQLVVFGNGGGNAAMATATNITFTNNQITGVAGGISLTDPNGNPAPAHEQGNSLVTLDVANSIITGNTFAGTTTSFHSALRVRRPDTVIAGNTFDSTNMGLGTTHLFVQNNTLPIQTIVTLNDFDKGSYVDNGTTVSVSITGGIGRAAAGDTLNVLAGTYAESVNVNKKITLDGAGSGNSATDTIIDATGLASGLAITASGTSAVDRVEVKNLRVSGATSSNVLLNSVSHVTLDNVAAVNSSSRGIEIAGTLSDLIFENVNASNNVAGLRMGTGGSLDGLVIDDSAFNNNSLQGIVVFAGVGTTTFDNVTITDSTFDGNLQKGLYFERLNNALLDNLTITNSGTDAGYAFNNGIDINLKYDDYSNITIQNSTFDNSGVLTVLNGGVDFASSLAIKARDDAPSYNTDPATLDNVLVQGNVFANGTTAIRLGEPGKNNAGPTNVVITQNSLNDGTFGLAVDNTTLATVNASSNWWGTTDAQEVDDLAGGLVDFTPFLNSGADTSGATGFQGDFSVLNVTALGEQTGLAGRIQEGINLVNVGGTVNVLAGTYVEDVVINKASVTVTGQGVSGIDETRVEGTIGGTEGATFRIAASGVTLENFFITRQGNNAMDYNNANLNFAGVAIQGQTVDGTIQNNIIYGNRTGIDVNNSNDNIIRNNEIDFNHTGLIFRNQTDNTTLTENFITDNRTVGVLFLDASGGTNSPLQQALNSTFFNNNISGNWYGQIVDRQVGGSLPAPGTTNLKDFSGNWLGNTDPVVTTANSAEPGYAALIPPEFGGTAMAPPPGSQPDVAGAGSANFDITPLLGSSTDTDSEFGFQGDFSTLYVTPKGAQVGGGGRIQEAVNLVDVGGTVNVNAGTYPELVNVNKTVTLLGAQAGVDARTRGVVPEAIVDATGLGGAFSISADDVVVDGFTVQGQTGGFPGAAIWMQPGTEGTEVRNNIIQNNVVGIFVSNNSAVNPTVIEQNLFRNNTNPGAAGGTSIYADQFTAGAGIQNILIDNNTFTNTSLVVDSWALGISNSNVANPFMDITFSNNEVTNHGRGLYFFNTDGATVSDNTITGTTNYAIGIFTVFGTDNNANIDIIGNTFTANNRDVFLDGYTGDLDVIDNVSTGAGLIGLDIQDTSGFANLNLTNHAQTGKTTGGSITNVGTVNLTTNDDDNTVDINGEQGMNQFAVVGQLQAINYTGVTTLNVDTLDGEDTVNVAAHPTTVIDLDGGDPMVPPGDTLNYLSDGVNAFNVGPATITTMNHANINYANFENVNVGGNLIINGSGDDDHLIINATGENSGTFQLIQNGIAGPVVGFSGVTSIVFNGLAGDDVMTINQPDNDFLNPTDGIVFNGGAQVGDGNTDAMTPGGDTLIINHAVAAEANTITYVFAPPTGVGNGGTITIADTVISDGSTTITFTGLEPVLDGMAAAARVFDYVTTVAEAITLQSPGDGGLENKIGSSLTESVSFNDPTGQLTVNAASNDSFEVLTGTVDLGAANILIVGGPITLTGNLSTTGNATLASGAGNITDNADDNIANLTANNVLLQTIISGNRSIGTSPTDRLEINANVLRITTAGTGNDVFLRDTMGGLQINDSSLAAGGSIFDVQVLNGNLTSQVGGMADLRADFVVVEVTGAGQIGASSGQPLDINANTRFDATSAGGDIFVRDATTGFPLGLINANGGNVVLTTNVGSFTDANGAGNNISAATATLNALSAVGTSADSLETSVDELIVTAATGIFIAEADAVTVTSAATTNGDIRIASGGTMTAVNVVAGGTNRNVSLTTTAGDIEAGAVTALGDRVHLNAAGSILNDSQVTTPIAVTNPSFEMPALADGGFTNATSGTVAIPGWEIITSGGAGVFNPTVAQYAAIQATEGTQVAFSNGSAFRQILSEALAANTTYELSVDIGDRLDTVSPGYTVGLYAGGVLLAQVTQADFATVNGQFITATLTFASGSSPAQLGQALEIRLSSNGVQTNFDNVLLTATSAGTSITAENATLIAGGNVGSLATPLQTDVDRLAANAGGDIFITNAGGLTISNLPSLGTGLPAVNGVSAGGDIVITATSPLTVAANVTSGAGDITLTATDSLAAGDDFTVNAGVTIQATLGAVLLQGGDNVLLADSSTVNAGTTITILGDFGNADAGTGSNISLLGTLNAAGTSGNITVQGGSDDDTILVNPGTLHTADGVLLQGLDGDDTYEVFFGRLNGGLGAVNIDDAGTGTDQATLQGTANGETFEIDGQMGGTVNNATEGEQVAYSGSLEFLTINGNQGNDTFTGSTSVGDTDPGLEPSFTTTITLDGEDPGFGDPNAPGGTPPGTGDTLILNSLGNVFQIIGTSIFVDGNGDMQVVTQNPPGPDAGDYQTINFRRIENLPLEPQGPDTLFFDFDHTPVSTVTQPGYQTVAKDQVFGMNGNTFGWDSAVGSFDSGAVMGSSFSDILRDGHSGTGSNTFTTQIANGVYLVTVKIGDAASARDDLRITNGDTGQILLDDIDTAMGQYLSQSFVVEVTDGTLDLTIANLGGLPLWVLNGLEIRPGQILTIGSPDQDTLEANGVEETTLQIFNVTPGALVTVTGFLDSDLDADEFADQDIEIVSADAAPEIQGVQIAADMSGEYYFTFRHPSGRGTGFFTFEEVTLAPATLQTGLLAVDFIAPGVRRFDFGTEASPVEDPMGNASNTDGYVSVVGTDVFEEGSGFGWDSAVGGFDRGPVDDAVQDELRQDGNSGTGSNTFRVELENGTYFVSLTIGDDASARDDIQVSAEGMIFVGDVDTAAGNYKHFTFQVTVTDGILDLELENLGGLPLWVINGLEIRPTIADADFNPAGGTPADGTSIELITGTAIEAAGLLLTVTTDQGVLVNDASAEYDGHQVAVNMDGTFTIELQRPSSTMDVTANLTVLAVDGSVQDATSVLFTGFAGQPPRRFDFNRGTSPTASGFTGVLVSDLFNMGDDFGWVTSPSSFDHFTANKTTVELYQDGATRSSGAVNARTFRVTATAATNYDVRAYIGAKFAAVGQVQVSIEGGAFVALSMPVSADNFTTVTLMNVSDVNMDGFLDIRFQGLTTSWYVNGVDVALSASGLPPAAALTFAAEAGTGTDALSSADLDAIIAAAITRLAMAGEDVSALDGVRFEITDLNSQGALGLAGSRSILIDDDGLGHGWFVDQTPFQDEEFTALSATSLVATSGEAQGQADLLTVVMHEFGHILGYGDLDPTLYAGQLMTGELNLGERHLPGSGSEATSSELEASASGVSSDEASVADDAVESIFSDWQISSQLISEDSEPEALRLVESESELALVGSSESEDELSFAFAEELTAVREETSALDGLFAELTQTALAGDDLWEQFEG